MNNSFENMVKGPHDSFYRKNFNKACNHLFEFMKSVPAIMIVTMCVFMAYMAYHAVSNIIKFYG